MCIYMYIYIFSATNPPITPNQPQVQQRQHVHRGGWGGGKLNDPPPVPAELRVRRRRGVWTPDHPVVRPDVLAGNFGNGQLESPGLCLNTQKYIIR